MGGGGRDLGEEGREGEMGGSGRSREYKLGLHILQTEVGVHKRMVGGGGRCTSVYNVCVCVGMRRKGELVDSSHILSGGSVREYLEMRPAEGNTGIPFFLRLTYAWEVSFSS